MPTVQWSPLAGDNSPGDAELVTVLRGRDPGSALKATSISYINPSTTTQARGASQKRSWEEWTSRRMGKGWVLSSVISDRGLIAAVVGYLHTGKPAEIPALMGGWAPGPTPHWGAMGGAATEGGKNHFFLRVLPLVGFPWCTGWSHSHAHMGSPVEKGCVGEAIGRAGGWKFRVSRITFHCIHVCNSQK